MDIEVFSFFSGLGFLDLGFHNSGFNIVLVNEIEKHFIDAYAFSRKKLGISEPTYGYLNKDIALLGNDNDFKNHVNIVKRRSVTGFIGGPPCPDFSFAGRNEGAEGKNGILTKTYVKLIIDKNPDFFVFENVKGLIQTKKHYEFYSTMKSALIAKGYHLVDSLVNALEFGIPQYRDRLILVGVKKRKFKNTATLSIPGGDRDRLKQILHFPWPTRQVYDPAAKRTCPHDIPTELTIQHWFDRNNVSRHINGNEYFTPKPTTIKFHTIDEGDTRGKSFKRLHRWKYSPTAAYGNNEVHLHPYHPRRLSVSEALAIQSLPMEFMLPEGWPLGAKFKMIGNGVPYLMAQAISQSLYKWIKTNHR